MSLADAKDMAVIVGVAIALVTLIKAVVEYTKQNAELLPVSKKPS